MRIHAKPAGGTCLIRPGKNDQIPTDWGTPSLRTIWSRLLRPEFLKTILLSIIRQTAAGSSGRQARGTISIFDLAKSVS